MPTRVASANQSGEWQPFLYTSSSVVIPELCLLVIFMQFVAVIHPYDLLTG